MHYRRLPLAGLYNARELGGYPAGGGVTRYRRFIRSDAPRALTPGDLTFLQAYGVTVCVDFRGDAETEHSPSCLAHVPWAGYRRSPTFNAQVAFGAPAQGGGPPVTSSVNWGEKYIEMAEDCKDWIRDTLALFDAGAGCILYNCTTGKDRTGIVSAVLLGLAGVSHEDILADYCVSEVYLPPLYAELLDKYNARWPQQPARLTDPFFKTAPGNMLALLRHIDGRYGGMRGYARACGVPDGVLRRLRARLLD